MTILMRVQLNSLLSRIQSEIIARADDSELKLRIIANIEATREAAALSQDPFELEPIIATLLLQAGEK